MIVPLAPCIRELDEKGSCAEAASSHISNAFISLIALCGVAAKASCFPRL
jgi:hypothetical protein